MRSPPDPPLRAAPALSATWPPPPVLRPRGARRRPGASRANPRDHSGAPSLRRGPHTLGSVGGRRPLPSPGSPRTSCSRGDAAAAGGGSAGRAPGDRRCARPPPQELGDMLVNWFHYPPPSASCVHGSNLNWSLHLSRRIATLYTSVSPRFSREGHSPPGPRGPAGCGCG